MEFVIELSDIETPDWFQEMSELVKKAGIHDVQLSKIVPPAAFGAGRVNKFKVVLADAASIAQILSLVVQLYSLRHPLSTPTPNDADRGNVAPITIKVIVNENQTFFVSNKEQFHDHHNLRQVARHNTHNIHISRHDSHSSRR